nr:hypothetical protein [Rhizorhabdus dicambivorans]
MYLPAQHNADAREQFARRYGLCEIVAGLLTFLSMLLHIAAATEKSRRPAKPGSSDFYDHFSPPASTLHQGHGFVELIEGEGAVDDRFDCALPEQAARLAKPFAIGMHEQNE